MLNKHSRVKSAGSVAMLVAAALLTTACGGGGSSTPAPAPSPAPAPAPIPNPLTGFVGTCPSLAGGAAGYEVGYCVTSYTGGTIMEGVFQNGPTSATESPVANQYQLNLPAAWGGTITMASGGANVTQFTSQIGALNGGYALDKVAPAPAVDVTSLVDFSSILGSPRLASFGLWGRSKLTNEFFYGGYYSVSPTGAVAPSSVLGSGTTLTMNGAGVSWYLRSSSTAVPDTVVARLGLSSTAAMTVDRTTKVVTLTLSAFKVRTNGVAGDAGLTNVVLTGTLTPATGTFVGTITSGGTGQFKGTIYGDATSGPLQAAGQFSGTYTDGRMLTGSFGVKI